MTTHLNPDERRHLQLVAFAKGDASKMVLDVLEGKGLIELRGEGLVYERVTSAGVAQYVLTPAGQEELNEKRRREERFTIEQINEAAYDGAREATDQLGGCAQDERVLLCVEAAIKQALLACLPDNFDEG